MTPRQRYHSEQFSKYRRHTRLLDQKTSVTISADRTGGPPRLIDDVLRELTCTAGAVFTGRASSAASNPIADGTFLFTDYEVLIDRIVRMPDAEKFRQPSTFVVVTRPGGMVLVDGDAVSATVSDFPFLSMGRPYLFFALHCFGMSGPVTLPLHCPQCGRPVSGG